MPRFDETSIGPFSEPCRGAACDPLLASIALDDVVKLSVRARACPGANFSFLQALHFESDARELRLGYPLRARSNYRKLRCESAALRIVDFGDGLQGFGEEGLGVEVLLFQVGVEDHG